MVRTNDSVVIDVVYVTKYKANWQTSFVDLLFQVKICHKPQFETYHNSFEGVIHHGDQHV